MSGRLRVDQYNERMQAQIAAQLYPKKLTLTDAFQNHPPVASRLRHPEPQHPARPEPILHAGPAQKGAARTCVIVTRCSVGTLDRDNLVGSVKHVVDGLRYSGRIAGDREQDIELVVFQKKVKRKDQGTLIEIIEL